MKKADVMLMLSTQLANKILDHLKQNKLNVSNGLPVLCIAVEQILEATAKAADIPIDELKNKFKEGLDVLIT